jgi:hypothetical protein
MYSRETPATELTWRTSSFCTTGACVEVAFDGDSAVVVRDSKNRLSPSLVYTRAEWRAFVAGVKMGEFDS